MKYRIWLVTACLLLVTTPVLAGEKNEDVTKLPGYVDFDTVNLFGDEGAMVEIFLEKNLLKMVAAVTKGSDPELGQMLSKLKQVRVQTFPVDDERMDAITKKTKEMAKRLEKMGWTTVVRVHEREEGTITYVYFKWVDDVISGLVVMNVDADEAAFVNIVGEIDPEQIGRIGGRFDIDALDSLDIHVGGSKKRR